MIFINPEVILINIPNGWCEKARRLTSELIQKGEADRSGFINSHSNDTWGHPDLLRALKSHYGNKCWYSEVRLEGADPNVDHFRPKGRIREVDGDLKPIKDAMSPGYWWLAFEPRNFRLASMHSNQRRVDCDTEGGKSDFFPVIGNRVAEGTDWGCIAEHILPLDPCSRSDVKLLFYDPDGKITSTSPHPPEIERVRVTKWLYHLDKSEIETERGIEMRRVRNKIANAGAQYKLWDRWSNAPNMAAKVRFDEIVAEISSAIADDAVFAGAKRCVLRTAMAEYEWVGEFFIL